MKYSFKKHIQNEYFTGIIFLASIVPIILLLVFIFISIIFHLIENKNVDLLINTIKIIVIDSNIAFILPAISFVSLISLITRIVDTKDFINNCIEIDAKIEKYLSYYGRHNYTHEDGSETAILVTFSYSFNNAQYRTRYSIQNNKQTRNYFDNYKEYGEIVKIFVNKKKPWRIKIKELYVNYK